MVCTLVLRVRLIKFLNRAIAEVTCCCLDYFFTVFLSTAVHHFWKCYKKTLRGSILVKWTSSLFSSISFFLYTFLVLYPTVGIIHGILVESIAKMNQRGIPYQGWENPNFIFKSDRVEGFNLKNPIFVRFLKVLFERCSDVFSPLKNKK